MIKNEIKVHEVKTSENGEIESIGPNKKKKIGEYNGHDVFQIGDRVYYKRQLISICLFHPEEARHMLNYYSRERGLLDEREYITFLQKINNNENPFACPELMKNMLERCRVKGYQLASSQIPEYIAYETFPQWKKDEITREELKWFHDHIKVKSE